MKTFSIFCIGTGHDSSEEYNILTVLHRLTAAENVDNKGKAKPAVLRVSNPNADQHKVLYDGPPNAPDIVAMKAAASHMIAVRDNAVSLVQSVNLPVSRSGNKPKITVNLVGHSRGAANCLMIASELQKRFGDRDCHCNLFLIDTVKVSNILSARGRVPEVDTRFIFDNVDEVVHIVMEDDVKFWNVVGIFKLYEIKEDRVRPGPDGGPRIKNIRFPGTHGTATQCNPLITSVAGGGLVTPPEKIWPIGGAVLSIALQKLNEWGTTLHKDADDYTDPKKLLYLYNRIQIVNTIVDRQARKRIINNVKLSTSGQTQERNVVPVKNNHTYRSDKLLNKFGRNLYRFHPVFVNPHHVELCIDVFGIGGQELVDSILAQFEIHDSPRDLELAAELRPPAPVILAALKRNILLFPDFFSLLKDNGLTWGEQPLDWRLASS